MSAVVMEEDFESSIVKPFELVFPVKIAAHKAVVKEQNFFVRGLKVDGEVR